MARLDLKGLAKSYKSNAVLSDISLSTGEGEIVVIFGPSGTGKTVLLPLSLYFKQLGLTDTYTGLIWVYQLICLPLILWIVRGYFEDISPDIEHAYRISGNSWLRTFLKIAIPLARPGIAAAALLAFIFAWNNFIFALILASASKQPVTVGALAFVTASGIQYGQIAAAIVLSVTPTLLLALYAQRYLVEGLSLGAVKG